MSTVEGGGVGVRSCWGFWCLCPRPRCYCKTIKVAVEEVGFWCRQGLNSEFGRVVGGLWFHHLFFFFPFCSFFFSIYSFFAGVFMGLKLILEELTGSALKRMYEHITAHLPYLSLLHKLFQISPCNVANPIALCLRCRRTLGRRSRPHSCTDQLTSSDTCGRRFLREEGIDS